MNFTYETQGAITYLVCELAPTDQVDSLTLGMLTNNHIVGLAPVLYTEMNGQRYLKYNISAKISAEQFFSGTMNRQRALTAFQNILAAICSADDYMIDQNCFSVASEHVFLNVSSCESALICIPIISEKDINPEVAAFFKKIMFSTQFDNSEDATYIAQLITYINSGASFSVYGLKDLVTKLQSTASTGVQVPTVQQEAAPHQPVNTPQAQQAPTPAPASSFDSTITMDEMPAIMSQRQAQQSRASVQNDIPAPKAAPYSPSQPQAQPQPQASRQVAPTAGARPINNGVPAQNNKVSSGAVNTQTPPVMQKPRVQNSEGFAIPGQAYVGSTKPQTQPAPEQKGVNKAEKGNEKKMTFFGLLSHYNKENAQLYKKQKEEKKAEKAAKAAQKSAKAPATAPSAGNHGQQNPIQRSSVGNAAQQPFAQPQVQPRIQPIPVQNSFNETTVLTPAMVGGETTALNVNPMKPSPYLTRVKTGERISINKPVFRIGKEKSYVDYFIADNTAISRSHANIHTENGEYFIEDTNSTNHTYINGKLINSNLKTKLTDGDKVRLANEDFTFSV